MNRYLRATFVLLTVVGLQLQASPAHAEVGANRAAVQIQGSGVNNVSKSWTTDQTIAGSDASNALANLLAQQTSVQRAKVNQAVGKAQVWVSLTCPVAGGCSPPGRSGWTNPGVSGSTARADAPIYAGTALH